MGKFLDEAPVAAATVSAPEPSGYVPKGKFIDETPSSNPDSIDSHLQKALSFTPKSMFELIHGFGAQATKAMFLQGANPIEHMHPEAAKRAEMITGIAGAVALASPAVASFVGAAGPAAPILPILFTADGAVSPTLEKYAKGEPLSKDEILPDAVKGIIDNIGSLLGNTEDAPSIARAAMLSVANKPWTDAQKQLYGQAISAAVYVAAAPSMVEPFVKPIVEGAGKAIKAIPETAKAVGDAAIETAKDIGNAAAEAPAKTMEWFADTFNKVKDAGKVEVDGVVYNEAQLKKMFLGEFGEKFGDAKARQLADAFTGLGKDISTGGGKADTGMGQVLPGVNRPAIVQPAEVTGESVNLSNEIISPEHAAIKSGLVEPVRGGGAEAVKAPADVATVKIPDIVAPVEDTAKGGETDVEYARIEDLNDFNKELLKLKESGILSQGNMVVPKGKGNELAIRSLSVFGGNDLTPQANRSLKEMKFILENSPDLIRLIPEKDIDIVMEYMKQNAGTIYPKLTEIIQSKLSPKEPAKGGEAWYHGGAKGLEGDIVGGMVTKDRAEAQKFADEVGGVVYELPNEAVIPAKQGDVNNDGQPLGNSYKNFGFIKPVKAGQKGWDAKISPNKTNKTTTPKSKAKAQSQAVDYYLNQYAESLSKATGKPKEHFIPLGQKLLDRINNKDVVGLRETLHRGNKNSLKLFTAVTGLSTKTQKETDEGLRSMNPEAWDASEYAPKKPSAGTLLKYGNISTEESAKAEAPAIKEEADAEADMKVKNVDDFGEKIGGARKDLATKTGSTGIKKEKQEGPAWAHDIKVMQKIAVYEGDKNVGKWFIAKVTNRRGRGSVDRLTNKFFDTEAEANAYIPLAVVAQNHRVYGTTPNAEKNGYIDFAIHRLLSSGKHPIVKGGFKTNEEAMAYMATHAVEIIEHKFPFPEKPWLDRIERKGKDYRNGKNVTTMMFQNTFGFRGGEFGKWNMGGDGQAALDHAYDALLDLAGALNISPKALSLNGQLSIAFGARGHGLSAARAHFEEDRFVINLTKIKGAGSLAHEWMHSVDSYLAMLDGKMPSMREDGVFAKTGRVTEGFSYNSKIDKDIIVTFKTLIKNLISREVDSVVPVTMFQKGVERATPGIRETLSRIDSGFKYDRTKYSKRSKIASPKDIIKWDALKEKLLNGEYGEKVFVKGSSYNKFGGFDSYQIIRDMNDLYKSIQGYSFDKASDDSFGRTLYRQLKSLDEAKARLKQAEAESGIKKTSSVATNYLKDAKDIDSFRSSDYWSLTNEMLSRAFESYIYDKLVGEKQRSDYLVYGVENKYYELGMRPYPDGDERILFNKSFDELFNTINDLILPRVRSGGMGMRSGSINISMFPGVTDIAEGIKSTQEGVKNTQEALTKTLNPKAVSPSSRVAARILRATLGRKVRAFDIARTELIKARGLFEKIDTGPSLEFMDNLENGRPQTDANLDSIAASLRKMYDERWAKLVAMGKVNVDNCIQNYFAHIWENPKKAGIAIRSIQGKRPFEGPKSFLKKRYYMSIREGIDAGLTPVTYNPVDMTLLKIQEIDRYIAAWETMNDLKSKGIVKFFKVSDRAPDGWTRINDKIGDVYSKGDKGEIVLRGHYYAEGGAALILNNYLSPGLAGNFFYDIYRTAGNTLTQFQLSMSAFHLGFTSLDAAISKMALAMQYAANGNIIGATRSLAMVPIAPVSNIMQGRKLISAWNGNSVDPMTDLIASYMAEAGGRISMDKIYMIGAVKGLQKDLQDGKLLSAMLKLPLWVVEQSARPIMEYIVPRQKLGVFYDLMRMELESNPGMSHEDMVIKSQKIWDSVDNRMGQMVYDNLFWSKVVKDAAMASVRSVGWNLGTIREIAGGGKDLGKFIVDAARLRKPEFTYRMGYLIALPILAAILGSIYQYLATGEGPQELKDYYFPRNGGTDKNGDPSRVSLPSYMKDLYHYTKDPLKTVVNKLSPVNGMVIQMLTNKDYYGTEIRHKDDPFMKQVLDEVRYVVGQMAPFSARNVMQNISEGKNSVQPFFGITPAPYDINATRAELAAMEIVHSKLPVGSRTQEQTEKSRAKAQVRNQLIQTGDKNILRDAVASKKISEDEAITILKHINLPTLARLTKSFTFEETASLVQYATPEEKELLKKIIVYKGNNLANSGVDPERARSMKAAYDRAFSGR